MAEKKSKSLWDAKIIRRALVDAVAKLDPRTMMKNPVMFVVEVGSVVTTLLLFRGKQSFAFNLQITLWLWFTVLFANFAEAMAEGRGKAQADTLRKARSETEARRLLANGTIETVPSAKLRSGDIVMVAANELVPGDGEVIEGVASVDESAITGESAPVIREAGGDRSAVTGGTRVLSDVIKVRITSNPGETFLDRMIALVEGAERQKTPNEIALNILLAGLTIIFLLAVVTLQPFAIYSGSPQTVFVLVSLLVCLIPTTIGGLLSAIDRKSTRLNSSHADIYTLSLHDALPISAAICYLLGIAANGVCARVTSCMPDSNHDWRTALRHRSEEHTSELQSRRYLHSFPTRRSSDLCSHLLFTRDRRKRCLCSCHFLYA